MQLIDVNKTKFPQLYTKISQKYESNAVGSRNYPLFIDSKNSFGIALLYSLFIITIWFTLTHFQIENKKQRFFIACVYVIVGRKMSHSNKSAPVRARPKKEIIDTYKYAFISVSKRSRNNELDFQMKSA